MVPLNLNFWPTSRKESLASPLQQTLRRRFLRVFLCSNHNFNPRYNRKIVIRKKTSNPNDVSLKYEKWYHRIQRRARNICQCNSVDNLILLRATVNVSSSGRF